MNYWLVLFFCGVPIFYGVVLAGLIALAKITHEMKQPKDDWLTTEGILDVHIHREPKNADEIYTFVRGSNQLVRLYHTDVVVFYIVNGETYTFRPIMASGSSLLRESAEKLAAQYESGKRVIVRYDPRNPQNAVVVSDVHAKPKPAE